MILLSIILIFTNNGKPLFFQYRPGKNEKIFKLAKFRTMNDKKDKEGNLLPDCKRLTKTGRFIRKTSLDELPQLFNILLGHMSLVGPRPLLLNYLPFYTEYERKRHIVRPGITGLAQVNGRNMLNWDKRLSFDVEYVRNISFSLDFKILIMTIIKVFSSKDIVIDPESIMKNLDDERRVSL